jgi:hypothetical protein
MQPATHAAHFPDLEILLRGGFRDAELHIGADIEDHDIDGADVFFDRGIERRDLFFLACIRAIGDGLAAFGFDRGDQRRELFHIPPDHARVVAFPGETLRNGAAQRVSGADDQRDVLSHGGSPVCGLYTVSLE